MEDGEIIEDEDDILMVFSDHARRFEDHDVVSMELGSDNDEAVNRQSTSRQQAPEADEAEELRELLLSQVLRKKRPERIQPAEMSCAASTSSSSVSKRSKRREDEVSPRKESSPSSYSSLLPPPPPPPRPDSLRESTTTEASRSRDSHSHEYGKVEKELDGFTRRMEEMGEKFADASSKYETARKRKRDHMESIAQCDATLAKYQRVMEGLWEEMVSLSSGSASFSLKGMKKMKSAHSKLHKTVKEQKERIAEKDSEIEQLRTKNQLLESIIRREEAAVEEKRRRKVEASRRSQPPTPDSRTKNTVKEQRASTASSTTPSPAKNLGSTTKAKAPTTHRRASKQQPATTRYFHLEGDAVSGNGDGPPSTPASSTQNRDVQERVKQPQATPSNHVTSALGESRLRLRPPPPSAPAVKTPPQKRIIHRQPVAVSAAHQSKSHSKCPTTHSTRAAPSVNGTLATPYTIEKEFEANPLLMFRAYRLSKNFPFHLITHPAVTNRIDPNLPLCPYMLNGRCADAKCPWQHESDYRLNDEEIIKQFMLACPSLCPTGVPQDTFISEQLKKHSVEEVARRLVSSFTDENGFSKALSNGGLAAATHFDHRPLKPVPECADEPVQYERTAHGWWEKLGNWQ